MSNSMEQTARSFFKACEDGEGWQGCSQYCKPDASFAAQAEPLADVKTLKAYTEWMKGLYTFMPDAGYELKSWAVDGESNNVLSPMPFFSERILTRVARSRQPERASDQTMST